eukprot:gene5976-5266_t
MAEEPELAMVDDGGGSRCHLAGEIGQDEAGEQQNSNGDGGSDESPVDVDRSLSFSSPNDSSSARPERGLAASIKVAMQRASDTQAKRRWSAVTMAQAGLSRAACLAKEDKANFIEEEIKGDTSMFDAKALDERHALRRHFQVDGAIKAWWKWLPKNRMKMGFEGAPKGAAKAAYCAMVVMMQLVLPEHGMEADFDYDPTDDWEIDCKGNEVMGFPDIFDALFTLTDTWCDEVSGPAYSQLLVDLLKKSKKMEKKDGTWSMLLKKFGYEPDPEEDGGDSTEESEEPETELEAGPEQVQQAVQKPEPEPEQEPEPEAAAEPKAAVSPSPAPPKTPKADAPRRPQHRSPPMTPTMSPSHSRSGSASVNSVYRQNASYSAPSTPSGGTASVPMHSDEFSGTPSSPLDTLGGARHEVDADGNPVYMGSAELDCAEYAFNNSSSWQMMYRAQMQQFSPTNSSGSPSHSSRMGGGRSSGYGISGGLRPSTVPTAGPYGTSSSKQHIMDRPYGLFSDKQHRMERAYGIPSEKQQIMESLMPADVNALMTQEMSDERQVSSMRASRSSPFWPTPWMAGSKEAHQTRSSISSGGSRNSSGAALIPTSVNCLNASYDIRPHTFLPDNTRKSWTKPRTGTGLYSQNDTFPEKPTQMFRGVPVTAGSSSLGSSKTGTSFDQYMQARRSSLRTPTA